MNRSIWIFILAIMASSLGGSFAFLVTDALWFQASGFGDVFTRTLGAQVALGALGALIVGLGTWASGAYALSRTRNRPLRLHAELDRSPIEIMLSRPGAFDRAVRLAAILSGLLAGLVTSTWWADVLMAVYRVDFGHTDPILGLDAGFYIFTLPALHLVRQILTTTVVFSTIVGVAVYFSRGAITVVIPEQNGEMGPPELRADDGPRMHIATLVAAFLFLLGLDVHLGRFDLVTAPRPLFDGPGWTDVNVLLPLLSVHVIVLGLAGYLAFMGLSRGRLGSALTSLALVVGSFFAVEGIPGVAQSVFVTPNELSMEEPFLREHTVATRLAWDLERVEERTLTGKAQLAWEDIQSNRPTIDNVRLWDHEPLLSTFGELQEIRTQYEFGHVDNDRYMLDGELRQIMVSPRELPRDGLPDKARTWVNETLVYTHGYGVAAGPVNLANSQGLPLLFVKDLPPQVEHPELNIDQAALYYGEDMFHPVIANTGEQEFDYPTATGNAYSTYDGAGGLPISNMAVRALLAWRLGSMDVLLTGSIGPQSRALLYRQVAQRVQHIAPFLYIDADPYVVVADGRLVWVVEAYTATSRFPYSQHENGLNYQRNSVKVTIDAYDGTTTFFAVDPEEPILKAWSSVFPGMFKPLDDMSPAVRSHLRYPQTLFEIQAELFAVYHMTDPQVFYNREDEWQIPRMPTTRGISSRMEPYYTVMTLPGETEPEFILMLPFTPQSKDNLAAWMVARSDGEAFGGLRVYRFPKDSLIFGPNQVAGRINQNDAISEKLTLWNQQGSKATLGTLLVVPIEESLIYVQPLYLSASDSAIPELKRVIVAYEDRIAMEKTLDEALRAIFDERSAPLRTASDEGSGEAATEAPLVLPTGGTTAEQAHQAWLMAQQAAGRGDWTGFGEAMEALGTAIDALNLDVPAAADEDASEAGEPEPAE